MKKYYIGFGIVLAAAFLMTLPYLLRQANSPSSPGTSVDEKQAPVESKTEIQSEDAKAAVVKIDISDFKFVPAKITVKKGTTVEWTNKDSIVHTVTADTTGPKSEFLDQNKIYQHTFNELGTFSYHCKPHPFMKGVVEVTN